MILLLLACSPSSNPSNPSDTSDTSVEDTAIEDSDCAVLPFYADLDGDGFGDPDSMVEECEAPEGYVEDATDCDDSRADVNPAAVGEVCEDLDCSGGVDSGAQMVPSEIELADVESGLVCVAAGEHAIELEVAGELHIVGAGPETVLVSDGTPFQVSGELVLESATVRGAHRVFDVDEGALSLVDVAVDAADCLDDDDCYGQVIRAQAATVEVDGLSVSGIDISAENDIQGVVLYAWNSQVSMADVDVRELSAESANTLAWMEIRNSTATVDDLRISGTSLHTSGSAVSGFVTRGSDVTFNRLVLAGNTLTAADGAHTYGLFMHGGGDLKVDHADIVGNTLDAYIYSGGFAYVNNWYGSGRLALTNSNVVDLAMGNGTSGEAEAFIVGWSDPVYLAYNNISGVTYPDAWINDDEVDVTEDLSADPLYVDRSGADPAGWDLRLSAGSPSLDAADPAETDEDGSRADIGAYGAE